jgi:hypothetical protein
MWDDDPEFYIGAAVILGLLVVVWRIIAAAS